MKNLPEIETDTTDGYAYLIGSNYDTLQESFCTNIPDKLVSELEAGQKEAQERHEGQAGTFIFGLRTMQIWSGGSQGNKWVLEDDDIQIHIRTAKAGWNMNVRYKAAGLWEYGVHAMRKKAHEAILREVTPMQENWISLSRVDFAFDLYSPEFSKEMLSSLVAHNMILTAGVKAGMVFTSKNVETLTIGMNRKGVQIQVYDKGKEIRQSSGKVWMYKVWEQEGYFPPDGQIGRDVWRVELRFGKDYLKDRRIKSFEKFEEEASRLLCEALIRRRMVDLSGFKNHKERAPLHAMWAAVFEAAGASREYIPIGRQITMRREEYIDMLRKQQAGIGRSLSVAQNGSYVQEEAQKDALKSVLMATLDPHHQNKICKAQERQLYLDEAQ